MFKMNDKVKFGDMEGHVVTTASPNEAFPIQVMFPKQKLVMGFKASGYFFEWEAGPKLSLKPLTILERIKYVYNLLRSKGKVDTHKQQA